MLQKLYRNSHIRWYQLHKLCKFPAGVLLRLQMFVRLATINTSKDLFLLLHLPMQALDGPAAADKDGRQVVEQIGMRGRIAAHAEIAGRAHQPGPEMMQPDAIDDHAGGKRVLRFDDRFG